MTIRPDFALNAETHLPEIDFNAIRQLMLHEAKEHDLPVLENEETRVVMETPYGCYCFEAAPRRCVRQSDCCQTGLAVHAERTACRASGPFSARCC